MKSVIAGTALFAAFIGQAQAADPLEQFKVIVERCRAAFSQPVSDVISAPNSPQFIKRTIWPADPIEFDVRKTDSLVSPFAAWMSISVTVAGERADSEAAAQQLVLSQAAPSYSKQAARVSFAYQGGEWVPTEAVQTYWMRTRPGGELDKPVTTTIGREQILKPLTITGRCVQAQG